MVKFLIILILSIVLCQEDYYKILGVSRDCDQATLKKQFKKLSLKYHPDKNKQNPEKAKEHFAQIVNAYETLIDPESRKVYDKRGKKGVEDFQQNGRQDANFDFGGFGGGHFKQHFQGGHFSYDDFFSDSFFQQQQQPQVKPLFENSDVFELNMKTISSFFRRNEVWLILFYRADEKQSQEKKDVWKKLAEKYYGIFKVAALNCLEEEEMCEEEFQVSYHPQVFAFPSNIDHEKIRFTGSFNEVELANFAVKYMESFVEYVTFENYQDFIKKDLYKVLLFTDKKSTPPLYKALSKEFKGKLIFGEVRQQNSPLIQKFNVKKMPTLMVITDSHNYQGDVYQGEYKKDSIARFIREYSRKKEENKVQMIFDINRACKDIPLCLVVASKKPKQFIQIMDKIQKQYPNIQMYILENPQDFAVVIKGKKLRYAFQYKNNEESLIEFLDDVINGARTFDRIQDGWPIQLRTQKLPDQEDIYVPSDL